MPATLAGIKGKVSTLPICLDPDKPEHERTADDYFSIRYRHGGWTAKVEQAATAYQSQQMPLSSLIEYILGLVVSWDLKVGPAPELVEAKEAAKFRMETVALPEERETAEAAYNQIKARIDAEVLAQETIKLDRETIADQVPGEVLGMIVTQVSQALNPNIKGTEQV